MNILLYTVLFEWSKFRIKLESFKLQRCFYSGEWENEKWEFSVT